MPSRRSVTAALFATLTLSASAIAQSPQPNAKAPAPASKAPAAPKPRAELLSPGAEPRTALRYTLTPDARWLVRPTTKLTPISEVDGNAAPVAEPPLMIRPFDLTLEGSPDPTAGLGFSLFVAPRVPEVGADGSEALRELVKGQPLNPGPAVRVKLSPRGEILEKQAPERTPRRPSESELGILDGLIIPLPEQPVGVGATWRINRTEGVRGYLGRHGLEATLVELKGNRAKIKLTYSRIFRAADEDALTKVKKELPDATIEGSSRVVEIAGDFELDLTCPVPISGSLLSKERDEIRLRNKGIQSRMIVGSDTKLTLDRTRAQ
ncbi:MAG: hypothetical protein SFY95_04395 [Planctomycetota bacterium]|nr:hypothetical protein [Planctomycetota bacterium]